MEKEKRWNMYFSIQQQRKLGLRKSQVARNLGISRNTVIKFWDMKVDEYKRFLETLETRSKKLSPFESEVVGWLKQYPDLSASQVWDWLKERHGHLAVAESTVRNFVQGIRSEYAIPKAVRMRQYGAVEELPMGRQMQVDFGETKLRHPEGHLVRLWFITFVLSHSRHKYAWWQDRPFTTADVVDAHEQAFAFYGGMPEEMVYDQDHLLLTSENHGDLILTHEFARYVEGRAFRLYMCRKSDPESKGTSSSSITRTVRKDNTIWYAANRYTVPLGTYDGTDKEVAVRATAENKVLIADILSGHILAEHPLCLHGKGELIRNSQHGRDRAKDIPAYIDHVARQFTDLQAARSYLEAIRKQKPRYIRDQLQVIDKHVDEANRSAADKALAYCIKHRLYRAADFADAVHHYTEQEPTSHPPTISQDGHMLVQADDAKRKAKPQIRDFQTYERILGGG